jgi:hypothetical protein
MKSAFLFNHRDYRGINHVAWDDAHGSVRGEGVAKPESYDGGLNCLLHAACALYG